MLTLAVQANAADWAHYYSDLLPSWGATYLGLEQASSVIRAYQPQVVPDLLQTEDVARALQRLRHPSDSVLDIERRVALQMTRQEILTDPSAPQLWAVIDQAALWWLAGSSALGEQVRHLITMAELPYVRLQMLPVCSGEHVAIRGPLTILRFADPELPDTVYHQQQTTALCLDRDEDVQHYRALMDNVGVLAQSPIQTINYLSTLLTNEHPQASAASLVTSWIAKDRDEQSTFRFSGVGIIVHQRPLASVTCIATSILNANESRRMKQKMRPPSPMLLLEDLPLTLCDAANRRGVSNLWPSGL